jgi:hypothetical protein
MADNGPDQRAPEDEQPPTMLGASPQWQAIAKLVNQLWKAAEEAYEVPDPDHEIWQMLRTGRPWAVLDPEDFPDEFDELRRLVEHTGLWVRRLPTELGYEPVPLAEWDRQHAAWLAQESKQCPQCGRTVFEWYDTWTPDGTAGHVCVDCAFGELRRDR